MQLLTKTDPHAEAARLVRYALDATLEDRPLARLAVPGGSASRALPDVLRGFPLDRLWLTWVDERCVAPSDEDSNRGALHRLLDEQSVPRDMGFELPLFLEGETPDDALPRVRRGLSSRFDDALDVVLLGMGADGHIASLFEDCPEAETVIHVSNSPKPPASRISLTRAMLATASHTVLLALGESKRQALTRLAAGDEGLPAHGLPGLTVITDLTIAKS